CQAVVLDSGSLSGSSSRPTCKYAGRAGQPITLCRSPYQAASQLMRRLASSTILQAVTTLPSTPAKNRWVTEKRRELNQKRPAVHSPRGLRDKSAGATGHP